MGDPALEVGVLHRAGDLHPADLVPGHDVRRRDVELPELPIAEAVHPGVLQKAPHNAGDGDVVGFAGDTWQQAADAPDDQLHPDTGLGGLGQLVDEFPLGDRVDLDDDVPLRAPGNFAVDQAQQMVLHGKGGHQQLLVAAVQVAHEHILEEVHRIRSNDRVGSEQGKVGVEGGGFFVEIASADLGDIAQTAVFLPAGNEADLGVALVAFDAVYHPAAGLLQLLGPFDVVLLIKPRPEFHQHGDRLAVFRCGAEVFGHSRVAGQPIDGHLDGEHLGVVGGLPEQPQEGLHRLVGIE